jgi:hypothetical protein
LERGGDDLDVDFQFYIDGKNAWWTVILVASPIGG